MKLTAVPFTAVTIDDAFWSPRMRVNRERTVPHILDMCELEGRVRNMLRAGGRLDGPFEGIRYHDADLFKAVEAASYVLMAQPDPALAQRLTKIVEAIAAAQQPDGYLDTYNTVGRHSRASRNNLPMFAAGHLLDAAVAYRQATGDDRLVQVARRFSDLIDSLIGPKAQPDVPAHPKIESALVRLYDATGQQRYLDLAKSFVDERGQAERRGRKPGGMHRQDHLPLRQQTAAEGHVICGLFLLEGMFDVGLKTGDDQLLAACKRVWDDAVTRRMYLTGNMGRSWDERFTEPYALDNRTSIGEGCQSAALMRLSQRLLLLEPDARYADVIERVVYNNLPGNVGLDGKTFYYVNRLSARREDATGQPYKYPMSKTARPQLPRFCLARQPWFTVPCCPPNIAMTIATLGQYVLARSEQAVYVNLYLGCRETVPVAGTSVALAQQTRYPWEPSVRITVDPAEPRRFDVCLRVPDWCRRLESTGGLYRTSEPGASDRPSVKVNGQAIAMDALDRGYLRVGRVWNRGDVIDIQWPMPIVRITCDPRVAPNAGRVALQRGPVVYCAEAVDHGGDVRSLRLPANGALAAEHRPDLLGGVTVLKGTAVRTDAESKADRPAPLLAIPYAAWCNREPGEMDVWLVQVPAREK